MNELGAYENGDNAFVFAPESGMSLSRADISALAQAKSANFSGQYIALRRYGVPLGEIRKLYLAGGFANYVNVENAIDIGFIANMPTERIAKVGNASLEGATLMLSQQRPAATNGNVGAPYRACRIGDHPGFLRHLR